MTSATCGGYDPPNRKNRLRRAGYGASFHIINQERGFHSFPLEDTIYRVSIAGLSISEW